MYDVKNIILHTGANMQIFCSINLVYNKELKKNRLTGLFFNPKHKYKLSIWINKIITIHVLKEILFIFEGIRITYVICT